MILQVSLKKINKFCFDNALSLSLFSINIEVDKVRLEQIGLNYSTLNLTKSVGWASRSSGGRLCSGLGTPIQWVCDVVGSASSGWAPGRRWIPGGVGVVFVCFVPLSVPPLDASRWYCGRTAGWRHVTIRAHLWSDSTGCWVPAC